MPRTFVSLFGSGGDVLPVAAGGGPISVVKLTSNGDNTNSQTYTTASITLTSGKVIEIDVVNEHFGGGDADVVTITGFSQEAVIRYGPTAGSIQRITRLWKAGDSSTGALTINIAGSGNKQCCWSVKEWTNVNTTTPYAQTSVTNNSDGVGDPNNLLLTLPSLIDAANNAISAAFGADVSAMTPDTGYTELSDNQADTVPCSESSLETQYKLAAQTTCQGSDVTAFADIGGIISEMKKA